MKKYKIAVTFPLTLWVEVEADDDGEALEKARQEAMHTPYKEWGDDMSTIETDIVDKEEAR